MSARSQVSRKIIEALELVMARCDGAVALDGEGFSKFDRDPAEALIDLGADGFDDADVKQGKFLVRKYRRQIEDGGMDVDAILNSGTTWGVRTNGISRRHKMELVADAPPESGVYPNPGTRPHLEGQRVEHQCSRGVLSVPANNMALPPPVTLDLPEKFTEWRHNQDRAVLQALDSPKRFVVLALPTGAGKSLVYMAAAKLSGVRTAFLTATKNLQSQLIDDFSTSGLVDIRGANNYECVDSKPKQGELFKIVNCDQGHCRGGSKCSKLDGGCSYFDQVRTAIMSPLVVTNYAYYMSKQASEKPLGTFELLVMDEAHDAVDELGNFVGAKLPQAEVRRLCSSDLLPADAPMEKWRQWAREQGIKLNGYVISLKSSLKLGLTGDWRAAMRHLKDMERLLTEMSKVCNMQGEWVCDIVRQGSERRPVAQLDPVWPGVYAERALFRGIKKVILTSATIRPKTLELLGVSMNDVEFIDFPSVFPKERRPVIHVPTVRVDKNIDAGDRKLWVAKIDAIIRARTDRKGIIHTVSYDRAKFIFENSSFRDYMLMHETRTARDVMEIFKRGDAPLILLSPSMTTGVDFPYDQCRYQIVAKIPFPDTRNKVMAARTKEDPTFGHYIAMQTLVQMAGRGMRAADDICETLVVDDHCKWFVPKWRQFAPRWFMESYQSAGMVPKPLALGDGHGSHGK